MSKIVDYTVLGLAALASADFLALLGGVDVYAIVTGNSDATVGGLVAGIPITLALLGACAWLISKLIPEPPKPAPEWDPGTDTWIPVDTQLPPHQR